MLAISSGLFMPEAAGAAALPQVRLVATEPAFSDLGGDVHAANIALVADLGIAGGYPDRTYRPGRPVTRGQMATFLTRTLKLGSGDGPSFTDVAGDAHDRAIQALAREGISTGFPDGTFRPGLPVSREQMATFLARAFELPLNALPTFRDVTGAHAAAVGAVTRASIAAGFGDGTFRPGIAVTRGQMATFLVRAMDPTAARAPAGVEVRAGQSIQGAVDANPAGTTFLLGAGTHRHQTVRPKSGDTFVGEPGAVMSGAKVLSGFTRTGATWAVGGQTQQSPAYGECSESSPRCNRPEEVFVDDVVMTHVGSLAEVGPGTWFFDYDSDTIHLGDDPTGRRVETSVTTTAFTGPADDVVIRDLTVEKYASWAQEGAIQAGPRPGNWPGGGKYWLLEDVLVRWNHGVGVAMGEGTVLRRVRANSNGNLGIVGTSSSGGLVEDSEIAYNNTAGVSVEWSAGGAKWAGDYNNLVVLRTHAHHNRGPGLWVDESAYNSTFVDNLVTDNTHAGIAVEISYKALIAGNTVLRNGFGKVSTYLWGSGIEVAASTDVEVRNNTVADNRNAISGIQQARGTGTMGPHLLSNLWVHDNVIRLADGGAGVVQDNGDLGVFTRNNRFSQNVWVEGSVAAPYAWNNHWNSPSRWQATENS